MNWLRTLIGYRLAGNLLLGAMLLLLLLHLLVFVGIVPGGILWGDLVTDDETRFFYEAVALAINLLFIIVVAARLDYITPKVSERHLKTGLWILAFYFLVNAIGNLRSGLSALTLIFALITLSLTLLSARLAIE
jgi:hypothetical protein